MPTYIEYILAFLLVAGGVFAFLGSLGLAKFDDFYMRLHGPTKATTLGLGCILTASSIFFSVKHPGISLHEVLITSFLFITAPVSAHLLSKTALVKGVGFVSDQPHPLEHPLNVGTEPVPDLLDDADEEE